MTIPYAIDIEPRATIPVAGGSTVFPLRRIYCIGRNYAAHAREMGGDPTREAPFFFQKAADAVQFCPENETVQHPYPTMTSNYHHEVEMVVALKSGGRNIEAKDALTHVFGYAVGLDMTRRDLQDEAKAAKRPWEVGKSADHSAPVGPLHPVSSVGHPSRGKISVSVDGEPRQSSDLSDMIWSVPEQISILSRYFELKAGDIIFTGTPEGVGKVERGQTMRAYVEGLGAISLAVV
ncbi:MAG: fumarylacetoacetate hydrolase family protein [Pseudomonadota bacterium]